MSQFDDMMQKVHDVPGYFDLTGRKALVVGGTTGLGQAMALALAKCGADVCVAGVGEAGFKETENAINSLGRKGMALSVDATVEKNVIGMMDKVVSAFGRLDILINSQGAVHLEPSTEFDMDVWDKVMAVNVRSVVLTCKHAGREMLKNKYGRIINISSVRGFQGRAGDLAYSTSKGGINQLTKSLAIEWGPHGINVNGIAPSFVRTEISAPVLNDPVRRDWVYSRSPMGRIGELDDLFGPAVFLASNACGFVNGHILMVDGGWLIA